ncbi:uncharacterized protein RJT21DRAFT_114757 [Scheffersomyces amazonensis]|uniref:uncharacterized protein n=1 Tax=Scheffersomyces amazonensis TaxID=1078765 RepID=UPI00315D1F07
MTSPLINHESFLKWDPAQVSSYIISILPNEQDQKLIGTTFLDQNIEGSLLPFITTDHLKELGISKLQTRLLIKRSISDLITDHYSKHPPQSFNDPDYELNNININNNYVSLESLSLSTVLIKDMIKKINGIYQQHTNVQQQIQSGEPSPQSPTNQSQLDLKKLNDNFIKLKTDLIPVIRLLKDTSKPLPTPTLDPGPASNFDYLDNNGSTANDDSTLTGHKNISRSNSVNSSSIGHTSSSTAISSTTLAYNNNNNNNNNSGTVNGSLNLPSPTYSNRFSTASVLSMGTGKIISQTLPKVSSHNDFKIVSVSNSGSNRNLQDLANNNSTPGSESVTNGNGEVLRPKLVKALSGNLPPPLLKSSSSTAVLSSIHDDSTAIIPQTVTASSTPAQGSTTTTTPTGLPKTTVSPKAATTTNGSAAPTSSNSNGNTHPTTTPTHTTSATTSSHSNEPLKQLRASTEDSCLKILQQAMKRHHIPRDDWSKYVLVICYGDKERILKLGEKPVVIFKELQELGKHPAIMLRQLATPTNEDDTHGNDDVRNPMYKDSRIGDEIPGGTL